MTRTVRWRSRPASAAVEALPADGWLGRLAENLPLGPIEKLLAAARATVTARASAQDAGYGLETDVGEPDGELIDAAQQAIERAGSADAGR